MRGEPHRQARRLERPADPAGSRPQPGAVRIQHALERRRQVTGAQVLEHHANPRPLFEPGQVPPLLRLVVVVGQGVERDDLGSGTSAATTKYIHGGIRYLEQYDFKVVRESLRERRILALGAPHLVRQTEFIMPAWKWSKPPTALIGAGVALYDALSYDRNHRAPRGLRIPHPRWLGRDRLLRRVPWLDPVDLQGGFAYHDTLNMHPERLLLAYVKNAAADGAVMLNHTEVTGFIHRSDSDRLVIEGVTAWDELAWAGRTVRVGVVTFATVVPKVRCLATHANPVTGERDLQVMQTLVRAFQQREPRLFQHLAALPHPCKHDQREYDGILLELAPALLQPPRQHLS